MVQEQTKALVSVFIFVFVLAHEQAIRAWFVPHRYYPERTKTLVFGFVFVLVHEQIVSNCFAWQFVNHSKICLCVNQGGTIIDLFRMQVNILSFFIVDSTPLPLNQLFPLDLHSCKPNLWFLD